MNKKILSALIVLILITTSSLLVLGSLPTNSNYDKYAEIVSTAEDLDAKVSADSKNRHLEYLDEFYELTEANLLADKKSEKQAIEETKNFLLSREALYSLAVQEGFSMTDKEAIGIMTEQFEIAKTAENYNELVALMDSMGLTTEEFIVKEAIKRKKSLTIERYMIYVQNQYEDEKANDINEWQNYWDNIRENAVEEFKNTPDGVAIIKCAEVYEKETDKYL